MAKRAVRLFSTPMLFSQAFSLIEVRHALFSMYSSRYSSIIHAKEEELLMPTLTKEVLHDITAAIFRAAGAPDDIAVQVADVLIDNHLAGHDSHGILRIPEYIKSVRAGEIIPTARPTILEETATSALVSGNWAFGQVTGVFAADLATEKAKRERVAVLSIVQAGHTGRLAAFTERA